MGYPPNEERCIAEEGRQAELAEVRSLVDKMQLALKSIPQPVQASTDVRWTQWALGAMVGVLSLFMFFVVYTLNTNFSRMDDSFSKIDIRFADIDARFAGIDVRLDGIDVRLDGIDVRLDGIDVRLDGMDARFAGIDNSIKELTQAQKEHNELYKHKER